MEKRRRFIWGSVPRGGNLTAVSTQTSPTLFQNFENYFQNRPHTTPDLEGHSEFIPDGAQSLTLARQRSAEILRTNAEIVRQKAFDTELGIF